MGDEVTQEHAHEFYYYPATNEDGWECVNGCDAKALRSPLLDRSQLEVKIDGLLRDLDMHNLLRVSNGSEGEDIVAEVAAKCRATTRFDQYSIILFIYEVLTPSHADYWSQHGGTK